MKLNERERKDTTIREGERGNYAGKRRPFHSQNQKVEKKRRAKTGGGGVKSKRRYRLNKTK